MHNCVVNSCVRDESKKMDEESNRRIHKSVKQSLGHWSRHDNSSDPLVSLIIKNKMVNFAE
jgi:hypothetical protein